MVKEIIDKEAAIAIIVYVVEPSESYEISVNQLLKEGIMKTYHEDEIGQFFEVGCRVKVKWTREEIGNSNWRPGWYVGEVQSSETGQDKITVGVNIFSFCFRFLTYLLSCILFFSLSGISLITLLGYVLYVNFVLVYYLDPPF